MSQRVRITVYFECGHNQEFMDRIEEKYPFRYCPECEDEIDVRGKYPWKLETEIIEAAGRWQETTSGRVFIADEPSTST